MRLEDRNEFDLAQNAINLIEKVWQNLRANKLAITVSDSCEEFVDKCCTAWNSFAECPKALNYWSE